jgi:hypothetical protein
VRLEAAAGGSALARPAGPLLGVEPASGARRPLAVAIDLALVLVVAAAGASAVEATGRALAHDIALATLAAVVGGLVAVAALVAVLRTTGLSPGRRATRLRTVDALSGLPPRGVGVALLALVAGRGRTVLTADLRHGRDPVAPRLEPVVPADAEATGAHTAAVVESAPSPVPASGARLVSDSGDDLVVEGPVLLGRAPEPQRGVRAVHALPDLSRGVARTHLLADWSNGLLWVTDLGAPGGTTIRSEAGAVQPLVPGVGTAVAPGWQIRLGGRTLTVRSLAVEEVRRGR